MSDESVIKTISLNCVPVALNLYKIRDDKTEAGDFFRKVQEQRPDQYQGIFVVTPEGKVLANQAKQPEMKDWTRDLLDVLDDGLRAFGKVKPRKVAWVDPQPFRGVGVRDDGSIVLAVSTRTMLNGTNPNGFGPAVLDRVELPADLVESLTVANSPRGTTWQVPPATMKQFYVMLTAISDKSTLPRPKEITEATLKGRVERVRDGIAYLSFEGTLAGEHVGEFDPYKGKKSRSELKLTGVGTCDARRGKLLSLTLIGDGQFRNFPPYDSPERFGAVAEWVSRR